MPIGRLSKILQEARKPWLEGFLNQELLKRLEMRPPDGFFHPSGISGKRARNCDTYTQFLLWLPKRPNFNGKTMRILDNGNYMHSRYQKWFKETGILVGAEIPIEGSNKIKGHVDAVIKNPYSGTQHVVELKSINNDGFKSLAAPLDGHEYQLKTYMGMLGITEGFVLYENKNDQEILIFEFSYDPDFWNSLNQRLWKIWESWKLGNLMEPKEIPECTYCPFWDDCWKTRDLTKTNLKKHVEALKWIATSL